MNHSELKIKNANLRKRTDLKNTPAGGFFLPYNIEQYIFSFRVKLKLYNSIGPFPHCFNAEDNQIVYF